MLGGAIGIIDRDPMPALSDETRHQLLVELSPGNRRQPTPARTRDGGDASCRNPPARAGPGLREGQSGHRSIQATAVALLSETRKSERPNAVRRGRSKVSWIDPYSVRSSPGHAPDAAHKACSERARMRAQRTR